MRTLTRSRVAELQGLVSLLLRYPAADLLASLPQLRAAGDELPGEPGRVVSQFLDRLSTTPLAQLQQEYVATFDLKRKCCLYLSYYLNGDTRRRGMALVAFHELYRSQGVAADPAELPDYLPMVLEFTATVDPVSGTELLVRHRAGLEVLQAALAGLGSAYADLVRVVVEGLPPGTGADGAGLAAQGPPTELVGIEPFGPPELTGRGVRS